MLTMRKRTFAQRLIPEAESTNMTPAYVRPGMMQRQPLGLTSLLRTRQTLCVSNDEPSLFQPLLTEWGSRCV